MNRRRRKNRWSFENLNCGRVKGRCDIKRGWQVVNIEVTIYKGFNKWINDALGGRRKFRRGEGVLDWDCRKLIKGWFKSYVAAIFKNFETLFSSWSVFSPTRLSLFFANFSKIIPYRITSQPINNPFRWMFTELRREVDNKLIIIHSCHHTMTLKMLTNFEKFDNEESFLIFFFIPQSKNKLQKKQRERTTNSISGVSCT